MSTNVVFPPRSVEMLQVKAIEPSTPPPRSVGRLMVPLPSAKKVLLPRSVDSLVVAEELGRPPPSPQLVSQGGRLVPSSTVVVAPKSVPLLLNAPK